MGRIWTNNENAEDGLFLCLQDSKRLSWTEAGLRSWVGQWVKTMGSQWDNVVFSPTRLFLSVLIGIWKPGDMFEPNFCRDGPPIPLYCSPHSPESLLDLDLSLRRNLGENNIKKGETNTYWMNQWVVGWRDQGRLPEGGTGLIWSCKNGCMLVSWRKCVVSRKAVKFNATSWDICN